MRSSSRAAAALAVLGALVVGPTTPASAAGASDLAEVRAATARFHNVAHALAAGYLPTNHCVPGMGFHYVKPSLMGPGIDPAQPEVLLYAPKPGGGVRLVGVEYLEFAPPGTEPAEDEHQVDPRGPAVLGQHFNGPMAGHGPGMPVHWDLHVWLWKHNKNGMFAQTNPSVTC